MELIQNTKSKTYYIIKDCGRVLSFKSNAMTFALEKLIHNFNIKELPRTLLERYTPEIAMGTFKLVYKLFQLNTFSKSAKPSNQTNHLLPIHCLNFESKLTTPCYLLLTHSRLIVKKSGEFFPCKIGFNKIEIGPIINNQEEMDFVQSRTSEIFTRKLKNQNLTYYTIMNQDELNKLLSFIYNYGAQKNTVYSIKKGLEPKSEKIPQPLTTLPTIKQVNEDFSLSTEFLLSTSNKIVNHEGGFRTKLTKETKDTIDLFFGDTFAKLNSPQSVKVVNNSISIHISRGSSGVASSGKGFSIDQSEVGAMAEGIERLLHGFMQEQNLLFLEEDKIERKIDYKSISSKLKYNSQLKRYWLPCLSLKSLQTFWSPYELSIKKYSYNNTFFRSNYRSSTSGLAAGNNTNECIFQGILELIERDHVAIWWYNKLPVPMIDLSSLSDQSIYKSLECHNQRDEEVFCLDLTLDLGVYVMATLILDKESRIISMGFGAHLSLEIAIKRSISECYQASAHTYVNGFLKQFQSLQANPFYKNFSSIKTIKNFPKASSSCITSSLSILTCNLKKLNLESFVQDFSVNTLDEFKVIRVIIPGLCQLYDTEYTERLIETPVKLGLMKERNTLKQLNNIKLKI